MRAFRLYNVACGLGAIAILFRGFALHYAHRCATAAANAVVLKGAAKEHVHQSAAHAAMVADTLSVLSIGCVLVSAILWFNRKQQAEPSLPLLLLVAYFALCLVQA